MLSKLFKRDANNEVVVAKAELKGKSTAEIIEEIHESFFTEVDRLLADAKVSKSTETTKQALIDKCKQLKELGFAKTKECIEGDEEIARLTKIEAENAGKATLIKAIDYFSVKYPNYKFITEESVKKICAKYNLIYGDVSRYIGTVPDKNLQHMKDFKIDENDACYMRIRDYGFGSADKKIITYKEYSKALGIGEYAGSDDYYKMAMLRSSLYENHIKCSLEIAAPLKDFNTKNMEVKDFQLSKIEIPDPVVLQPVQFANQKFYLIVTAWGLEASDELVVNQKMN